MLDIQQRLFDLQDLKYKTFTEKLVKNIEKEKIIGVRVPLLRKLAREYRKDILGEEFMKGLPHKYFEEDNLHALLINENKDLEKCLWETEFFLPYIDNWATCDMLGPKIFKTNTQTVYEKVEAWLASTHVYTVRFAIVTLLSLYLEEDFSGEMLEKVASIQSQEYYINMAIAWYMCEALIKQYDSAIKVIQGGRLSTFVQNKSIQKARESYRISPERKTYLQAYKK